MENRLCQCGAVTRGVSIGAESWTVADASFSEQVSAFLSKGVYIGGDEFIRWHFFK